MIVVAIGVIAMRSRWQLTTVDTAGRATRCSLAFSPSGNPGLAYYSSFNDELRYATLRDDGSWDISRVDAVPRECKPSLAFRFGQPAISYRVGGIDGASQLRYALLRAGNPPAWESYSVAASGDASSLAFNSSQNACISYYDPETKTLKYTTASSPAVWTGQTVDADPDVGDFNALALTPLGGVTPGDLPAIAYYDRPDNYIKYAVFNGAAWQRQRVLPGLGWCSLAFDPAGWPAIGFSVKGFVANAFRDANADFTWQYGAIPGGETGSVAYPPNSRFRHGIAYTKGGGELKYAFGFDFWPDHFSVARPGKTQTGELIGPFAYPSLAFTPSGQPAIGYYDSGNDTIKYAVGSLFRTPMDDLRSMVNAFMFAVRAALKLGPNPSLR
jgi:hypothetical protein